MDLDLILGPIAGLSLALLLWQWVAARRFPLHQRSAADGLNRSAELKPSAPFQPNLTLLKPLKGCDPETEKCLRSWFNQDYAGEIQLLLSAATIHDPVCRVVEKLIEEFPHRDARLVICDSLIGTNAKVSKLAELTPLAKHETLVISDADVRVPPDFLRQAVLPLRDSKVGLVNCFYRLANPTTFAMHWEAVAINADFWSQVLQSKTLKPLDFALGAVMLTRRERLQEIGGFQAIANCLADDYQLGHRIARQGHAIELCPVVVECWNPPMSWGQVWKHQLRWAHTIRVCQPMPYFLSILSNPTLWPLLWLALVPGKTSLAMFVTALALRVISAWDLQRQLTDSQAHVPFLWLAPVKDLLQTVIWMGAFTGNKVEWRGQKFTLRRDGNLVRECLGKLGEVEQ